MYKSLNRTALIASLLAVGMYRNDEVGTDGSTAAAPAPAPKPVPTKEEKLASIKAQIDKLTQKYDDVLNDRVVAKTVKAAFVPEVGATVIATIGRNTATTQAKTVEALVVAVKAAEYDDAGKLVGQTQIRVQFGQGFDAQLVTLYPANVAPLPIGEARADLAAELTN